jgi:D-alanyl-D-alanine carboxypeptidase (penicillin-binding protein 5/6)
MGIFSLLSSKSAVPTFSQSNQGTAEIVMDVSSGRILHQANANEKMFMASTTKILTAIVIIENCNVNDEVEITNKTVGVEGSSIYLRAGEKLSVKELLFGLMLRSGNDCAETLAVHCSGTIEEFALLMNQTAYKIGAKNSNFVNPHGLHDDNHYTTAHDLAKISCYAMKNDIFREIVSTKRVKIANGNNECPRVLINKNKMLHNVENCTGIKTGFTKKAGRCLVSSVKKDGLELVCVVLNCGPMYETSTSLINQCFSQYKPIKILESDNVFDFVDFDGFKEHVSVCIEDDIILPLKIGEESKIRIESEYYSSDRLNQNKSNEIGIVKIYIENNLIFSAKLFSILDINNR